MHCKICYLYTGIVYILSILFIIFDIIIILLILLGCFLTWQHVLILLEVSFFLISISLLSILIIWLLLLTKGPFLCFLHPNWGSTTKVRFVFCFVWSLPCLFLLLNIFKVYGRRDFFLLNGGILSFSPTGFVFWMFFLVFTIFRKILLGLWVPPGPSTLLVFAMLACC